MSPGQTGHITGQMGRVPGTDGTHTRGCPAKILYVYWFFSFPTLGEIFRVLRFPGLECLNQKMLPTFHAKNGVKNRKFHSTFNLLGGGG